MLLFWLLGPYAADAAINLCNCVYLCLLWPYTTSPARGVVHVLVAVAVCSDSSGGEIFPLPSSRYRISQP